MSNTNDEAPDSGERAARSSPIPPHLSAHWGAFLYEGLMTSDRETNRARRVLDLWGQGCIELIQTCCDFLPEVWRQVETRWNDSTCLFPGIFEYEVVSEFGQLLGDYLILHDGKLPDDRQISTMIRILLADFFNQRPSSYAHVRESAKAQQAPPPRPTPQQHHSHQEPPCRCDTWAMNLEIVMRCVALLWRFRQRWPPK